jgi:hypothetical protein
MSSEETPYLLPDGERVWVLSTAAAAENLTGALRLFRSGKTEPVIFGDAGQPEAVVVPWETWRRLDALAADERGFDHAYDETRRRLDDPKPSVPLEDAAAQIGWDLDEEIDDSDFKPR